MTPHVEPERLEAAVAALRAGRLVGFPTETVYGVGADAEQPTAVRRIFEAKGRPPGRPLSVHLGPRADFGAWAAWTERAQGLAERFWPGPLTLILPRSERVADVVTGGLDTVGLRVPSHPVAVALLDTFGGGVAGTSANRSGGVSPTRAEHVRTDLGDAVEIILDGGECPVGVESTVLSLVDEVPRVLRLGATTVEALELALGGPVAVPDDLPAPRYAPRTPLRVVDDVAAALRRLDGPVAVVAPERPVGGAAHWVPAPASPGAWARDLYRILRELDAGGFVAVLVEAVPRGGLWDVIADRLAAAAAGSGGSTPPTPGG